MKKSMQTKFSLKLLKYEKEYNRALSRLNEIFHASPNSPEGQEAELLAVLIEEYEKLHYPISAPDPIEAIRIRMEEMNLKQKDLVDSIGSIGIISEVLNKKRKLTVGMIRNLSAKLSLSANTLIQDYELNR